MSIPDLAMLKVNASTAHDMKEETARTIIIAGSKSAGKSNLLNSFLDKTDTPRETLVLEYSFGRKLSQKQNIEKTICHVWEYGGRLEMLKSVLISIPIQGKLFYCVMVDLSKVKTIWNTLEICIQAMTDHYSNSSNIPELTIIGGKYDLFKNYDSEIKKIICTTIRSLGLLFNCDILFYSSKDAQLVRKAKETFYSMGFGSGIPLKEKNTNFTKPLIIPKGLDNWESIGVPNSTLEQVKNRHLSRISPEVEIKPEAKVLQRTHPEPILDSLAALKYEELRNMESFETAIDDYLLLLH